ncbi:MAG TPA: penicillin-binding transpeptidase domain-containing protein, partial [Negativicutes bacterium]
MAKVETTAVQRRIAIFLSVLLLCIVVLSGRIAWVQFVDGKRLREKVQTQLQDNIALQSPRGTIYDRNGRELAVSGLTKSLYANPAVTKLNQEETADLLAPVLEMKADDIKEQLAGDGHFSWIKRRLEPAVSQKVMALIKEHDLKGLEFVEESKRYYPNDSLAAQVLGFVGTDDVGLSGMEFTLDKVIKGHLSEQTMDTDNRGKPIFQSVFSFMPPKQGKSVSLTIDSAIQFFVEQSLDKAMGQTHAKSATAIVMNPRTGEVLAMASRPAYNPNQFYRYGEQEWKNRAVSNIYEPGSTFKSVVAAAALQENLLHPDDRFIDKGYVEVSGRRIQNWSGESYGNVGFVDVIKNSINTCFVQIGMRLGAERLTNYARAFGFGQVTGIELPGEEEGLLFDSKDMRDSDTATMSIGQSIAVTPLQLLTAVSAIANDGILLKPYIIKEVHNADGTLDNATASRVVRQVISSETAHTLSGLMEKVVSEGGGIKAGVKGYRFAGKTGTAERLREGGVGGYEAGQYIASFVGFGPVENPQVAILVVIDDPEGGNYYGGEIAAPVASEILGQLMRYLNILPQGGNEVIPAKASPPPVAAVALPFTGSVPPGKVVVPDVTGKSMREAGDLLNKLGLAIIPTGTGVAA